MKKTLILIVLVLPLMLTNCKFFGGKSADVLKLEAQLKADSLKYAAELDQIKQESQSKLDSIQKCCKGGSNNAYFVITGSFRNPSYADEFSKKMVSMGYKSEIIQAANGFNLVSAFSGNNLQEALTALSNLQNAVDGESWIYTKN